MSTIETLEDGLRRITAPNPSPMTGAGTNTYVIGDAAVAVIDPGPDIPSHLDAILAATRSAPVSHILVTHAHLDHSALSRRLSDVTGAPVLAYGDARAGRSAAMAGLADPGGGEGADHAFAPDLTLGDTSEVVGNGWRIGALWTPGHFGNHMCFAWNGAIFTGDLVMGWSTSIVSPPDGDMADFMSSCERLREFPARRFYPGHGAPVGDPAGRIDALLSHRRAREASILAAVGTEPATAHSIARAIYTDTPATLMPAAARNVLAHLVDLAARDLVIFEPPLRSDSRFARSRTCSGSSPDQA